MLINVCKAKSQLSKLQDMVNHGKKITITKNNIPIADLVPHKLQGKRKLGILKGKIVVPDNFCDEDEDINKMFYGD